MEKILKEDINVIDFVFINDDEKTLIAKLENTEKLQEKLNIKPQENARIEIYFNYIYLSETSEFEILIIDKETNKILQDIFLVASKNELGIVKAQISKKLRNLKCEDNSVFSENINKN